MSAGDEIPDDIDAEADLETEDSETGDADEEGVEEEGDPEDEVVEAEAEEPPFRLSSRPPSVVAIRHAPLGSRPSLRPRRRALARRR